MELDMVNVEFDPSWRIHRVASLSKLYLSTAGSVVPTSIWQLPNLQHLKLADIGNVRQLPDNIPPTATLHDLHIVKSWLTDLPDTIIRLTGLTNLRINSAYLGGLPDQFTQLSSLRVLDLSYSLTGDVALRSGLTALERLLINRYKSYNSSIALPAIYVGPLARFSNAQSLSINKAVPDNIQFGVHSRLTSLEISYCPGLRELPASMGNLTQLRELKLDYDKSLERLPDEISRLTALTSLTINGSTFLPADAIASLTSLRSLALFNVDSWDCVTALTNLENLRLADDEWWSIPEGLRRLTSLTRLTLANTDSNSDVPDYYIGVPEIDGGLSALSMLPRLQEVSCFMWDEASADQDHIMLIDAASITRLQVYAVYRTDEGIYEEPSFPPAIASLHNLRKLDLMYHCDTPHWPDNIGIDEPEQGVPDFVFSLTTLEHLAVDIMKPGQRLSEQVSRQQQLRVLELPESMLLCGQVTQLQRLEIVEFEMQAEWSDDAEHTAAVNKLRWRGVSVW
jgi:hypothetical protein